MRGIQVVNLYHKPTGVKRSNLYENSGMPSDDISVSREANKLSAKDYKLHALKQYLA